MNPTFEVLQSKLVHAVANRTRAIAPVVTPSAAFGYESAEEAEAIFSGTEPKPLYARMGNPTTAKLEQALAQMEGGLGAIATSSGMGALAMVLTALLEAGDRVLCIGGLFGGTYTLAGQTFARFGIESIFCSVDESETIQREIERGVKLVLFESVGNPALTLPDIKTIVALAKAHHTLTLIDNTMTPVLLRPLEMGVDLVMYSTTKNIAGFAGPLGGAVIFRAVDSQNDTLLDEKYKALHPFVQKAGKKAFMAIFKKRALRDIGMSASAFNSYVTMLGLETLPLRIDRIASSVSQVVLRLKEAFPKGYEVSHPMLTSHPHHERYKSYFPNGCGPLFTIECGSQEKAFSLLNRLTLAIQTANIGDNRTLALHMASTIYRDFSKEEQAYLGVTDGLVRVSVGLESPHDIVEDFVQAAKEV